MSRASEKRRLQLRLATKRNLHLCGAQETDTIGPFTIGGEEQIVQESQNAPLPVSHDISRRPPRLTDVAGVSVHVVEQSVPQYLELVVDGGEVTIDGRTPQCACRRHQVEVTDDIDLAIGVIRGARHLAFFHHHLEQI